MMYSAILCEGTADQILISYYLQKVLGYEHIHDNKTRKILPPVNTGTLKGEWYKDPNGNKLLILEVGGNEFSEGLASISKYNNSAGKEVMFKRICVVTDNDDANAAKRISQMQALLKDNNKIILAPAIWNNVEMKSGYGEPVAVSLLFLLQPLDFYGNIEIFILNMCAAKNQDDKIVVDEARLYIKKVRDACRKKYLKTRGEQNKGKLSAFFAAVSPQRVFSPINELLREIDWQEYQPMNNLSY